MSFSILSPSKQRTRLPNTSLKTTLLFLPLPTLLFFFFDRFLPRGCLLWLQINEKIALSG